MALVDDLARIAASAAPRGAVSGVLAAEPAVGVRRYLVAYGDDSPSGWLVLDDAGDPVNSRGDVRATASIVALCELAGDLAGGGDLEQLRSRLAQVRMLEQPPGIEEAQEAALALERTVGGTPRLATPGYLDEVGAATAVLERALGETSSPFSTAIRSASGAVEEFVRDVERGYLVAMID